MAARRDHQELELLRRRIWMYRARGMSLQQIANAVGLKSKSAVHAHLKKHRQDASTRMEAGGQEEVQGEIILLLQDLTQEALRNMTQVDQGSPLRATWLEVAGRRLDRMVKFCLDVGIINKSADKVELSVRDVRKMSDEEIRREITQLREELAISEVDFLPPQELDVRDGDEDEEQDGVPAQVA